MSDPVAVLTGLAGGLVTSRATRTVTFFRGVSADEAAQIRNTRTLQTLPGQVEGKYLTNSSASAAEWGRRLYGETASVVRVGVSRASAKTMTRLGRIDGIGEAWFAELAQLKNAVVRIMK